MNDRAHIAHLYAVLGDGRLNIYGSKTALEELAAILKSLPQGETREFALTVAETPHYGRSLSRLRCSWDDEPLQCIVDSEIACITGHWDGREHLADALESLAKEWLDGGHRHVYPADRYRDDTPGYLVSPGSEEVLIGGYGYMPDEMFGLSPRS